MASVTFTVYGQPVPGGSKRAVRRGDRTFLIDDSGERGKTWRQEVAGAATVAMGSRTLLEGPLILVVVFSLPRPKHHYRSNGELKPTAPLWHTNRPDATKLLRALEDALTGIVWRDDSAVAEQHVQKQYTSASPNAYVTVRMLP